MTTLETIIKGGTVESYRYDPKVKAEMSKVPTKITCLKERMKRKKPIEYFKGLMPSLVDRGYLRQTTTKSKHEYAVSRKLGNILLFFPFVRHRVCIFFCQPAHPCIRTLEELFGL
jgi:hypothetical protein